MHYMQDQRVLIDFVNREIAIDDAKALGGNRGYEIIVKARQRLGQLIITHAVLDDVRVAVIVDTGAQGSVGNVALLKKLRRPRSQGSTAMTDVNGQVLQGEIKIARRLAMGRVTLSDFPILFADSPPFRSLGLADEPALILGMSELRAFRRVAVDFESRQILFDVPRDVRAFDSIHGRRIGA